MLNMENMRRLNMNESAVRQRNQNFSPGLQAALTSQKNQTNEHLLSHDRQSNSPEY